MNFLEMVYQEYKRAQEKFGPMHSAHEALGVMLEEFDEFKAEVYKNEDKRDYPAMLKELVQVAAVCLRTVEELHLIGEE